MTGKSKNYNKEIENIKKNQMEILELKITISEMKNSQAGVNSRFEEADEKASELEDRSIS